MRLQRCVFFTSGFAKWRNEASYEVVCQLGAIWHHLLNKAFWEHAPFMQHVDRLRHWNGGCGCHEAELLGGKKAACDNKGMRKTHLLSLMNKVLG